MKCDTLKRPSPHSMQQGSVYWKGMPRLGDQTACTLSPCGVVGHTAGWDLADKKPNAHGWTSRVEGPEHAFSQFWRGLGRFHFCSLLLVIVVTVCAPQPRRCASQTKEIVTKTGESSKARKCMPRYVSNGAQKAMDWICGELKELISTSVIIGASPVPEPRGGTSAGTECLDM